MNPNLSIPYQLIRFLVLCLMRVACFALNEKFRVWCVLWPHELFIRAQKERAEVRGNRLLLLCHSHTCLYPTSLAVQGMGVSRLMKRNHFRIIAEILETAKDGAKKTRIMYRCNLSYRQTKKLVSHLLETELLTVGSSYHTTEKGLQFLKAYQTLELLLNTRN